MPDLEPTLTDSQVLEFCKRGYMMLEGVVTEEVNRQVREYLADHPYEREDGGAFEDQGLLQEPWFVDGVLLNRQAPCARCWAKIFACPPAPTTTSLASPLWARPGTPTASLAAAAK